MMRSFVRSFMISDKGSMLSDTTIAVQQGSNQLLFSLLGASIQSYPCVVIDALAMKISPYPTNEQYVLASRSTA